MDKSKQWMGIGKAYKDKLFDELDPKEKMMDFDWKNAILESYSEEEIGTDTFYQDYLFKDLIEKEDLDTYKLVLREYFDDESCIIHKIDLMEISDYLGLDNAAVSPCLYYENYPKRDLLNYVCAFVLDIDKLRPMDLQKFLELFDEGRLLTPTVIVNSGSGVHFYYILNEFLPIDAKNNSQNKEIAMNIYNKLYDFVRNDENYKDAQRHWIGQDYRVVGSQTKLHQTATAWKLMDEFYTIHELMAFCDAKIEEKKKIASKRMISYAKSIAKDLKIESPDFEDYIATYNFIFENKDAAYQVRKAKREEKAAKTSKKKKKTVEVNHKTNWYKQTFNKVLEKTVAGNRFNSLKALAIIAVKEKVPQELFFEDLDIIADAWSRRKWKGDAFNVSNIKAIKRLYENGQQYDHTRSETLEEWLGWEFRRIGTKRNGQSQVEHLEEARMIRDLRMKRQGRDWRYHGGAPTAELKVRAWQEANPGKRKADCSREIGLDPKTVRKWWQKA